MVVEGLLKDLLDGASGRATLQVVSGSMRPCLQEGDRIEVAKVSVRRLWPGDVVLFQSEAGIVVHRLIWRENPLGRPMRVYTKGDALEQLDRAVDAARILGRVERIVRGETALKPVRSGDRVRCLFRAARHGMKRLLRSGAAGDGDSPLAGAQERR